MTLRLSFIAAAVVLLWAGGVSAQPTLLVRGDASGTLGAQAVSTGTDSFYRRTRFDGGFFGGLSAGWYWTEHLKTEIDFGGRTKGRQYEPSPILIGGVQTFYASERTFSRRTLGVGQQYQFLHNAWFHPHLAVGANLSWERSTVHVAPAVIYDPQTRTSRVVNPDRTDSTERTFEAHPFVESGFKGYMTPRTFFRGDLRVAFQHRVDDVMLRFGFGFDF